MIRLKFWNRKGFAFPEGRLYEDVAISIPLHYEANKVSAVREIGYRWRNREGANKSITQKTDTLVNLEDRLYVLRLLFDYADRRMKGEEAVIREMKYKFLTIDIRMFVDKAMTMKCENAEIFRKKIAEFLSEYFTKEDFDQIDEANRNKYRKFLNVINGEL